MVEGSIVHLREELREQERVREILARLHDADDCGVDLVLPILEDSLARLLVLLLRLAQLDRVDFDAEQRVLEACAWGARVGVWVGLWVAEASWFVSCCPSPVAVANGHCLNGLAASRPPRRSVGHVGRPRRRICQLESKKKVSEVSTSLPLGSLRSTRTLRGGAGLEMIGRGGVGKGGVRAFLRACACVRARVRVSARTHACASRAVRAYAFVRTRAVPPSQREDTRHPCLVLSLPRAHLAARE